VRAASAAALVVGSLALAPAAAGSFAVRYPDAGGMASRAEVVTLLTSSPRVWWVEVADRELFGGLGLRQGGARAVVVRAPWRFELESAVLQADVGRECRAATRAGVSSQWTLMLGVTHDRAEIDGFPVARRTTLGLRTAVALTERVHLRCETSGFAVGGVHDPGADIETGVTVIAAAGFALTSVLVVDRSAGAHARFSAAIRVPGDIVVTTGYDDESATLSLALTVTAGSLRAAAGVSAHPVLGVSRGASVGWGR
jgi:hypothetical protein